MSKSFYSLGLMSGTSMDGVDASIIQSNGETKYKLILDKYFEYTADIFQDLTKLRYKINSSKDLKIFSKEVKNIEKKITLFHAKAANEILKKAKVKVDFIGLHGQTIYHNAKEKISKQLGDGKLLSQLTKKTVVCNFRQNDLDHGGEGAPLAPIFHKLLINQKKLKTPIMILNIGGIANWTLLGEGNDGKNLYSADVGPGNCLIDQWMRKNSKKNFDKDGSTAKSGNINKAILNIGIDSFKRNRSYDIKDFDLSFINGLSLEDGAATLTEYTSYIISKAINALPEVKKVLVSGGGRKNKFLLKRISRKLKSSLQPIDNFAIDGDFIESQAFAYLAIRSFLKLPISFPETTGVKSPCSGGVIINFNL